MKSRKDFFKKQKKVNDLSLDYKDGEGPEFTMSPL